MRVAAADIGTNSTRLIVADVEHGAVGEVVRLLEITRLGQGVDAAGELEAAAMARVLECLARYAEVARTHGAERLLAVATSAVRDASNRDALLTAIAATGFTPRVLSGEQEAEATFAGVLSGDTPAAGTLVIDVGGGSTELVLGGADGTVAWSCSLQMGCVRMTERFLGEQRADPAAVADCVAEVRRQLEVVPATVVGRITRAIGVAGTATTAAAIELGLTSYDPEQIHGARLTREAIARIGERLGSLSLSERTGVPGLEPKRAPVIVAGLIVLGTVLDSLGLELLTVSERDILHGAALLAASAI